MTRKLTVLCIALFLFGMYPLQPTTTNLVEAQENFVILGGSEQNVVVDQDLLDFVVEQGKNLVIITEAKTITIDHLKINVQIRAEYSEELLITNSVWEIEGNPQGDFDSPENLIPLAIQSIDTVYIENVTINAQLAGIVTPFRMDMVHDLNMWRSTIHCSDQITGISLGGGPLGADRCSLEITNTTGILGLNYFEYFEELRTPIQFHQRQWEIGDGYPDDLKSFLRIGDSKLQLFHNWYNDTSAVPRFENEHFESEIIEISNSTVDLILEQHPYIQTKEAVDFDQHSTISVITENNSTIGVHQRIRDVAGCGFFTNLTFWKFVIYNDTKETEITAFEDPPSCNGHLISPAGLAYNVTGTDEVYQINVFEIILEYNSTWYNNSITVEFSDYERTKGLFISALLIGSTLDESVIGCPPDTQDVICDLPPTEQSTETSDEVPSSSDETDTSQGTATFNGSESITTRSEASGMDSEVFTVPMGILISFSGIMAVLYCRRKYRTDI